MYLNEQIMKLNWSVTLSNPIYKGLYPQLDPFDDNYFYIGDGWGSTYPSMKLRKLSLGTGSEIQSAKIRNSIRTLYFNPNENDLFLSSDNGCFKIDRSSLEIKEKFKKGILKHADFISSNDIDQLLLMNHRGSFLMVFDYKLNKGFKKKIGESCGKILKENDLNFLFFDCFKGIISRYNLNKNTSDIIYQTSSFSEVQIHQKQAYLREGDSSYDKYGIKHIKPKNIIKVIDLNQLEQKKEIKIDEKFERFIISECGNKIFLWYKNKFKIISTLEKIKIFEHQFDSDLIILSVIEKQNKMFLYSNHGNRERQLFCYDLTKN